MTRPQTILFGNGINRVTPGCPSWSELLAQVNSNPEKCADFDKIPFTQQYEILLPERHTTEREIRPANMTRSRAYTVLENAELKIKKKICDLLGGIGTNHLYTRLAGLDVQNYLTTNYEYLLHEALVEHYGYRGMIDDNEKRYSIRRRTAFQDGRRHACNVWNIHGEIDNPASLMLGVNQYGEAQSNIIQYTKGLYSKQDVRCDSIEKRMSSSKFDDKDSWIQLFFYSDVHIFAFGFDLSETDLWWLVNFRMRVMKKFQGQIEPNEITYYGELPPATAHLLKKSGVNYVEVKVQGEDYAGQYDQIFTKLQNRIGQRRW